MKPSNKSSQEGFVYLISLLIEYFGVDEVVGGLTRQILQCYMILSMWLNLWQVVGWRKGVLTCGIVMFYQPGREEGARGWGKSGALSLVDLLDPNFLPIGRLH